MRKNPLFVVLALCMALSLVSCNAPATSPSNSTNIENQTEEPEVSYVRISAEEAKAIMDESDDVIVVDVRTSAEYRDGHIDGAVLLPNETIGSETPDELPDLDAEILIYCRSGNRSRQAAMKLIDLGYTNVKDFGGIIDWPYEVVK